MKKNFLALLFVSPLTFGGECALPEGANIAAPEVSITVVPSSHAAFDEACAVLSFNLVREAGYEEHALVPTNIALVYTNDESFSRVAVAAMERFKFQMVENYSDVKFHRIVEYSGHDL